MLKIAITGNIASGKSQVEKYLSKHYSVFDTDKIAHKFLYEIKDFYGYDVFTDGIIDRKKLGSLVFENEDLKKKLESIIHPKVKSEILKLFEQNINLPAIFISVPLLYETHFETLFDKVILVTANEDIRLERLMKRNNFTDREALARIKSQMPEEVKIKKADFVIENNSTIESLEEQIQELLTNLFG